MATTDLEKLIESIAAELWSRMPRGGMSGQAESLWIDDRISQECASECHGDCSVKTHKILECGADRISTCSGLSCIDQGIAHLIDHTLLKPDATEEQIRALCEEARTYQFASVCVNAAWVKLCARMLKDSCVKVATVVAFPLGATLPSVKAFEAKQAICLGADEVDMVMNIGALKSRHYTLVEEDIEGVVDICHRYGAITKVIIETFLLNDEEKIKSCTLAKAARADFVKTSTGFSGGGATAKDIELMRRIVGPDIGVKASGGVRTFEDVKQLVAAGATRIGASASIKIVEGFKHAPGVKRPG
jgi:deoxyribose-phosphate aldolase